MASWNPKTLRAIAGADELRIASHRPDGSLRPFVTIWHAVVDGTLYVRSAHGPENGWFRRALRSGSGRVAAGGASQDVDFRLADPGVAALVDHALHAKYDRYGPGPVGAITGPHAASTTLLVDPRV